jgi:uroporphyrinogen decarboxylase
MDTPVENLLAVTNLVYDEYLQQATREMEHTSSLEPADLQGHWEEGKVIVDVITLDSGSCAPCQYMMEAMRHAASEFGDNVIVNEFRIKDTEGIRMMMALGVKNVPTTCINGKVEFISQIPPKSKIVEAIKNGFNR